MIPVQRFASEADNSEDGENDKSDSLLNYFELHKGERSPVSNKTNAICRDLATILG